MNFITVTNKYDIHTHNNAVDDIPDLEEQYGNKKKISIKNVLHSKKKGSGSNNIEFSACIVIKDENHNLPATA